MPHFVKDVILDKQKLKEGDLELFTLNNNFFNLCNWHLYVSQFIIATLFSQCKIGAYDYLLNCGNLNVRKWSLGEYFEKRVRNGAQKPFALFYFIMNLYETF